MAVLDARSENHNASSARISEARSKSGWPVSGQFGNVCLLFTSLFGELPWNCGQLTKKMVENWRTLPICQLTGQRDLAILRLTLTARGAQAIEKDA